MRFMSLNIQIFQNMYFHFFFLVCARLGRLRSASKNGRPRRSFFVLKRFQKSYQWVIKHMQQHRKRNTRKKRTPLYRKYSGQTQWRNSQAKIMRAHNLHGRCLWIHHGRASHSPALSAPTPCTHTRSRERMRGRWLRRIEDGAPGGLHAALLITNLISNSNTVKFDFEHDCFKKFIQMRQIIYRWKDIENAKHSHVEYFLKFAIV